MAEEVFPGYQESIDGLRGAMTGADVATAAPARSGGMDVMGLMQQMLMSQAEPAKTAEKPIPQWLWAIPGAAKGIAMRKQMDHQDEELKLRKQTLAGQEATQKLQQLTMMQKIQQQQAMKRWGGLYGGLVQHDDVLDETAKSELEGQLVREMAEGGDPEKIEKFLEARKSQKLLKQFDAMEQQYGLGSDVSPETPQAPAPVPASPAPAATDQTPQGKPGGGYAQMPPMLRDRVDRAVAAAAEKTKLDPSEIYGIIQAESNFDPNAESEIYDKNGKRLPGAIGLMQLMPGTAADLKVDPRNIEQNVLGGARYYAEMKAKYKDPRLALAAYNAGPGRVDAAGGVPNIAETQGYVPRALKAMGRFLNPGSAQAQTNGATPGTPAPDPAANEAWQRDKLKLVGLQEQAKRRQLLLDQTTKFGGFKEGKAQRDAWQSSLKDLKSDIQTLEKKTAFTGDKREHFFRVPLNYATPAQITGAETTQRQNELEDFEKKQQIAARIEPPGAAETRRLQQDKLRREEKEAPAQEEMRSLQRQKLQDDIDKEKRERGGVLLPQQRMKAELDILGNVRQEPAYRQFMEVRNGLENVQVGRTLDNSQGDLAIVNGYAKILDPPGTVREGDFATVSAAQGFFEKMGIKYQTFMKGDRLAPGVREKFLEAAEALGSKKATSAHRDLRSKYEPISKRAGLNFEELVPLEIGIRDTAKHPINELSEAELIKEITRLKEGK